MLQADIFVTFRMLRRCNITSGTSFRVYEIKPVHVVANLPRHSAPTRTSDDGAVAPIVELERGQRPRTRRAACCLMQGPVVERDVFKLLQPRDVVALHAQESKESHPEPKRVRYIHIPDIVLANSDC
jgi:hypothetical protein